MSKKRGQPAKAKFHHRVKKKTLCYSQVEMMQLEEAYELSGSPKTFSRWLATLTLEGAEKIRSVHRKEQSF